ncbi:hypothetical protein BS47DRAFT_1377623 [Hydnum rufescens UP504]|uniref:NAD(+) diphosphatase n=1 Tax=Hydnum rufescens UP504 TaxID=1448309 RepID=A0A9P6AP07_9AGAM|nr:hypothetical protein BS47DRAFT_1377623 [Hydnum rufescens UP504]
MANFDQSHFMGGSPLNRLSWLRSSPVFLTTALSSPKTTWIIFYEGRPLVTLLPLLGPAPYFAQGQSPGQVLPLEYQTKEHLRALESSRLHGLPIFKNPQSPDDIQGEPFFALDATEMDMKQLEQALKLTPPGEDVNPKLQFGDARNAGLSLNRFDAAVFSEARTMVDWNSRNKFCSACGSPLYSLWGGWKLSCSTALPWADNGGRAPCPTTQGLHNTMHPRTDPVVIMAVLDETGEKILLGRNVRSISSRLGLYSSPFSYHCSGFYSCLAGFLEPSESFEEAVTREIWEESGIRATNVRYHSCQFPFPANLMIGCFAIADSSQKLRTDLDNELDDARWFTREEVLGILSAGNTNLKRKEMRKLGEQQEPPKKSLTRGIKRTASRRRGCAKEALSPGSGPNSHRRGTHLQVRPP